MQYYPRMNAIRIAGFAGSIRSGSYNRALLRASQELAPEGIIIEIVEIADLPVYNMDLELNMPDSAKALKNAVKSADGVLMVTPEHNHSFSGVLKNAIDWGSRPYGDSCFEGKPVILQSASSGVFGGVRAQAHLRQVLSYLEMKPMQFPEVYVTRAKDKFDEELRLTDDLSRQHIGNQLAKFKEFILSLRS